MVISKSFAVCVSIRFWAICSILCAAGTSLFAKAEILAHWRMEEAEELAGNSNTYQIIRDEAVGEKQGNFIGDNMDVPFELAGASADHLVNMNGFGDVFVGSSEVPPDFLFQSKSDGGGGSYDASMLDETDGALFYPKDLFGNEFALRSWTVEVFFKTHGDLPESGTMSLLVNSEDHLHFALKLSESSPGALDVLVGVKNGENGSPKLLSLSKNNYADGSWTYVVATYDARTRELSLRARNELGKTESAEAKLDSKVDVGFGSNMLIGRAEFTFSENSETFMGLIDEVRIADDVLKDEDLLGKLR